MLDNKEYESIRVVGEAGNGLVKVTVNGFGYPVKVEIDESLLTPSSKQILYDFLVAAMKEGMKKSDEEAYKIAYGQLTKIVQVAEAAQNQILPNKTDIKKMN